MTVALYKYGVVLAQLLNDKCANLPYKCCMHGLSHGLLVSDGSSIQLWRSQSHRDAAQMSLTADALSVIQTGAASCAGQRKALIGIVMSVHMELEFCTLQEDYMHEWCLYTDNKWAALEGPKCDESALPRCFGVMRKQHEILRGGVRRSFARLWYNAIFFENCSKYSYAGSGTAELFSGFLPCMLASCSSYHVF